jgi:hypothetical protein
MFVGNRMFREWSWSAAVLMLAAAALRAEDSGPSNQEQLRQFHENWVATGRPTQAAYTPKWGTETTDVVNVHAYDFQANTSNNLIMDDGNGYRYFGDEAVPYMAAPVRVPAGVTIESLFISHCSANEGDLVVAVYDNGVGGAGGGGGTPVAGPIVTNAGCRVSGLSFDFPHLYNSNLDHPLYIVVYFAGGQTDGSAKFNSVSLRYRRQVSPGDVQARFDDVPTSDFGFRYIEALAASGITGGCGGANYCPDQAVNRRQMAVFIAKALGLNWAD